MTGQQPNRTPSQETVDAVLDAAASTLLAAIWTPPNVPYASVRRTAALALANALDLIDRPLADAFREESRRGDQR